MLVTFLNYVKQQNRTFSCTKIRENKHFPIIFHFLEFADLNNVKIKLNKFSIHNSYVLS